MSLEKIKKTLGPLPDRCRVTLEKKPDRCRTAAGPLPGYAGKKTRPLLNHIAQAHEMAPEKKLKSDEIIEEKI